MQQTECFSVLFDKYAANLWRALFRGEPLPNLPQFFDGDFERAVVECLVLGPPRSRKTIDVHELVGERANVVSDSFEVLLQEKMLEVRLLATARKSKPVNDEIDHVLARHYGFTEKELDFIINYDIKYRMRDE